MVILPKDQKERTQVLVKIARGETAKFVVNGKTYTVVPQKPKKKTKPPKVLSED